MAILSKRERAEARLRLIAEELCALHEPAAPQKLPLEDKLSAHSAAWRRLYTEGCAEVCRYAMALYPPRQDAPSRSAQHGVLLMKIAHDCFTGWDAKKGDFIHFLANTIKTEFARTERREQVEAARGGMGLPEQKRRLVSRYLREVEGLGKSPESDAVQQWWCRSHGADYAELQESLVLYRQSLLVRDDAPASAGEEVPSVFETDAVDASLLPQSAIASLLAAEAETEALALVVQSIDAVWHKKQQRAQEYLGALATQEFLHIVSSQGLDPEAALTLLDRSAFADRQQLTAFRTDGTVLARRDLLERFPSRAKDGTLHPRDESRASHDSTAFLSAVRTELERAAQGTDLALVLKSVRGA